MTAYLKVLSALGSRVKLKRERGVMASCPAHDDPKVSLSVGYSDDGTALIKCFANCASEDVVKALNLEWTDLFPPRDDAKAALVATYRYEDETGNLLYEVLRYSPKGFKQRRANGEWRLGDVRRVLYRLPEVVASKRVVWFCEGERDADNLVSLGMVATTSAGGASAWRDEYAESLRGKHVVCLPDNDEPGFAYMEQVSRSLHGIATSVRVVALPGLKPKQDVSDFIAKGGTRKDLEELAKSTAVEKEALDAVACAKKIESIEKRLLLLERKNDIKRA